MGESLLCCSCGVDGVQFCVQAALLGHNRVDETESMKELGGAEWAMEKMEGSQALEFSPRYGGTEAATSNP